MQLEVRAPQRLELLPNTQHSALGNHGFSSRFFLRVFDNFKAPMPFIDANEDFGTATLERGVSQDWQVAFNARTKGKSITPGNAVFQDRYQASVSGGAPPPTMSPKPSNPLPVLGTTRVGSFDHDWYVGSSTTGSGVHVSHHKGVFFADHGEYTKFQSPP
jgi:hypothetical protein